MITNGAGGPEFILIGGDIAGNLFISIRLPVMKTIL